MTLADLASRIGRDIKALRDGKVDGDDARLSDARTPTAHQHAVADVDGLQAALPRTTTWQVLGTVPGLTAGECLFRWANGQPQLSLKGVEWLSGASIPWSAMPAGSRINFNARSSAILSGTAHLATQRGIVAYYAGTNFIYMGPEASPMPMSGMITWTI